MLKIETKTFTATSTEELDAALDEAAAQGWKVTHAHVKLTREREETAEETAAREAEEERGRAARRRLREMMFGDPSRALDPRRW